MNGKDGFEIRDLTFTGWMNASDFVFNLVGDSLRFVDCVFDGISPLDRRRRLG